MHLIATFACNNIDTDVDGIKICTILGSFLRFCT